MSGEAYVKRYPGGFVDLPATSTAIDSSYLNGTEAALARLLGADPTDAAPMIWDQSLGRFKTVLITNAHVAGGAAIARTKLDFGAGLVDGDLAPGANVAQSKIAGLTTALANAAGGTELGYVERTTDLSVTTAATEATPVDLLTLPAITFDGTISVVLDFFAHFELGPTAGAALVVNLWGDGANISRICQSNNPVSVTNILPVFGRRRLTPTAGSHTYVARAWAASTTSIVHGVAPYPPASLRMMRA
jgi:hypothetical protein